MLYLVRKIGFITLTKVTWEHRGSAMRLLDLGTRMPQLLRTRDSKAALTELKSIFALDKTAPSDLDVRITGVDDGSVVLRGGVSADRLERARKALLGVSGVLDVRTDAGAQPTLDATMATAS
jgi:hypothetical protein